MKDALVSLERVAFGYEGRPVVRDVTFEVSAGTLVGVLGPNGAGKTTLLRGVAGLLPPLEGSFERRARRLGWIPQREILDPIYPLTTAEVVQMGAYARLSRWGRLPRAERGEAREALERVGLGDRGGAPFAALSGGQRQRALVARALVERPELCLFDEPTRGVDRESVEVLLSISRELAQRGSAVLWVSHDLGLTARAADEVLWVAGGATRRLAAAEFATVEALGRRFAGEEPEL